MTSVRLHTLRLTAVAVATAVLLAVTSGCGDSNDDSTTAGDGTGAAATTSTDGGAAATTDRARPRQAGADGAALLGDVEQARAGAVAVKGAYDDFDAAIASGLADVDAPVGDTLASADGSESLAGVCDLMSADAQRETVTYAKRSAGLAGVDWTCEKAVALLLRRAGARGAAGRLAKTTVIGVNADGDRATATVRVGGKRGRVTTLPLVKEDGKWKLASGPGGAGG